MRNLENWERWGQSLRKKLRENEEKAGSIGVWVTENYLVIPAETKHPLIEPWATISQYIMGWYYYHRLKKTGDPIRSLHIAIIPDCYGYPGTLVFTVEGSPPKGRMVVELHSYEVSLRAVTFIGERIRRFREGFPTELYEALNRALKMLLQWKSDEDD